MQAIDLPITELIERHKAGETFATLCKEFNIGTSTLYRNFCRAGYYQRRRGKWAQLSVTEHLPELLERYEAGESCTKLAKEFGASPTTLAKYLSGEGADIRSPGRETSRINGAGYTIVRHPTSTLGQQMVNAAGETPEHRIVMAEHLGRPLTPKETVHHKDGNKTNNTIQNLQLHQGLHGSGIHLVCGDCGSENVIPTDI